MARLPRLIAPGFPHHVIQRGHNRQNIFYDGDDRQRLLELWREYSESEHVAVHSYVLMDNHVHLLVTPETGTGLSAMMQAVGRRYVQYFNRRHRRTGTLWEGRFRSTIVQSERYLLACMVYIDLNPVRAGMVATPADFPWSSHRHYTGQRVDRLVTPHALYWQLGNTPFDREQVYAELVAKGVDAGRRTIFTDSTLRGRVLGDPQFVAELETLTGRHLERRGRGRPTAVKKS